jgi:hypothetical protein
MDTIKLQAPDNCGGFSHEGTLYTPDANGCIEFPRHLAYLAYSHGFTAVSETPFATAQDSLVNFAKLNKKQLLAFAKENLEIDLDETKTNKELIAEIEAALEA